MAAKVVHTQREDKQKQLGCMNGIFQLFDRRYLLGLHRHGPSQNRLTAGEGEHDFKNSSEKATVEMKNEKNQKMMIETNRASVESSRNSFSSSNTYTSTTSSSFDCSRRVQTEWQLPSESSSPNLHNKQPDWSSPPTDIRDVVKESMTRETRVTKNKRASPVMKHIDSPRPFIHQNQIQYDRREISRFSCDEKESQYSLKSTFKVKEPSRLSLDSKQNSNCKSMNESRSEPGSNKRPSSGVVARLMGLDGLTDSVSEVETLKFKPDFNDQLVSSSPREHAKIKPALHQHDGDDRVLKKPSVYGEMEKKLGALKFNTSGKDLRALKQILEAIQMSKTGFPNREPSLDLQKPDKPCSPMVKGTSSPKRLELVNRVMEPEHKMITKHHDVTHSARKHVDDRTSKNTKTTSRTPSARLQKSKNGIEKQCLNGPSSDLSRIKIKRKSNLKPKQPKIKPHIGMQNNEQSFKYTDDGDTVSVKSKSNINQASHRKSEPKEHHRNNLVERLIEKDKPMVELEKISVEQPSPISVLDAFYIEDTPSPIKNKSHVFNDNENLHKDQTDQNRVDIYDLVNNTCADQDSEFKYVKFDNRDPPVQQNKILNSFDETQASQCKSTNADHEYIREILLASGFLQDLDSAIRIVQLHPTSSLIKPELFQLLESPNDEHDKKNAGSRSKKKIRRKLIFDFVNEILILKLVTWNEKICGRFLNGEKLLKELCSEIDVLQNCSKRCLYDEDDDEVKKIVSADVNKTSEDWDKCCYEVPGVVLDIERLIFKDLIDEVVKAEVASLQDRPRRHYRRLFSEQKIE